MVLVTRSWKMYLVGLAASLLIFGVVYFAVIQPNMNTANQAIRTGLQQSQQALNQAQQQINSATGAANAAGAAGSAQASQATGQVSAKLSSAEKLAACVAKNPTDPSNVTSCQSKFGQ